MTGPVVLGAIAFVLLIITIKMDPAKPRGLTLSDPVARWKRLPPLGRVLWVMSGLMAAIAVTWFIWDTTEGLGLLRWVMLTAAAGGLIGGGLGSAVLARMLHRQDE